MFEVTNRLSHTLLLKMPSDIIVMADPTERVVYSPPHIAAFVLSSAWRNPGVRAPIHLFRSASNSLSMSIFTNHDVIKWQQACMLLLLRLPMYVLYTLKHLC